MIGWYVISRSDVVTPDLESWWELSYEIPVVGRGKGFYCLHFVTCDLGVKSGGNMLTLSSPRPCPFTIRWRT